MADQWLPGGFGFPPTFVGRAHDPSLDEVVASVDGWSAASRASIPRDGTWVATLSDWSGWVGGVSLSTDSQQSPVGDGLVAGPTRLGGRTITLSGLVLAGYESSSPRLMHEAGEALAAVLTTATRLARLRVQEPMLGLTREADVRLAQGSDFTMLTPQVARWSLYLVADDPLRYEAGETIIRPGQTVWVPNRGRIISRPLVEFVGPLTAPDLSGFVLGADVPAGVTLVADMRQRIVTRNGLRTFTPAQGFWQNVPVGGTSYKLTAGGTGYVRVRRSSAWT